MGYIWWRNKDNGLFGGLNVVDIQRSKVRNSWGSDFLGIFGGVQIMIIF